jgi:peptide/nickel transport system substrate-binding protein
VVADDVIFTFELARDPARDSLYGPALKYVSDISAPGDRTVVISLDEAHCPSLAALGELPIVPHHLLDQTDLAATSFDKVPVGSGPLVFVESTPEGEVHLARNDDYWGGAPYLDAWSYRPFENAGNLHRAVESEQIDVALMPPGYLPSSTDPAGALSAYRYPAPEFLFVAFNNDHPVLGDPKVRLALSMAVDREQLLDQALAGGGELIAGSLPSAHWAADPDLRPPDYDPEGARQFLAEAGWTDSDGDGWLDRDGERLRLPVRTNGGNQLREDLATLVASYYRAIGVDAPVELVIWGAVVDDLFTHDFDTIVFSWPLSAEPDQSQWWLSTEGEIGSGYNFVSFADESVDRLLQEAVTVPSCDAASRAGLYRQVQDALAQERPYDFLLIPYAALLARPDLRGLGVGTFSGPFDSATDWYIQP